MVEIILCFIHIKPIVSSTCFVIDYTLIHHKSIEGTETAKGLYIPTIIEIRNINIHMEVSTEAEKCQHDDFLSHQDDIYLVMTTFFYLVMTTFRSRQGDFLSRHDNFFISPGRLFSASVVMLLKS